MKASECSKNTVNAGFPPGVSNEKARANRPLAGFAQFD
jgi:hypothetical protein